MTARVVFVCVENSCRSQMAEGFARALGPGVIEAYSAGSKPSGRVNATAARLMLEVGVDISAQASKGLAELPAGAWDWVVTMGCGDACPHLTARRREDWALLDPKHLPDDAFRAVRDEIASRVKALAEAARSDAR